MKDLTFTDAIFIGYSKSENGYDIVFSRNGEELRLPAIFTERTKADEVWDKRTGLLKKYGSIQQDPKTTRYYFEIYQDQSLRRVPELDIGNDYHNSSYALIGWRNDKHPDGFLAPNGIIPDFGGKYIADKTKVLSLLIPKAMEDICKEYNTIPELLFFDFTNNLTGATSSLKAYLTASYGKTKEADL